MKTLLVIVLCFIFLLSYPVYYFWNPKVAYYSDKPHPKNISSDDYDKVWPTKPLLISDDKVTVSVSPPRESPRAGTVDFDLSPNGFDGKDLNYKSNKFDLFHAGIKIPMNCQPSEFSVAEFRCSFDSQYLFKELTLQLDFVLIQGAEEIRFKQKMNLYRAYIIYPFLSRLLD